MLLDIYNALCRLFSFVGIRTWPGKSNEVVVKTYRGLVRCDAVWSSTWVSIVQWNILPP
jgi:hypothetical protein